MKSKLQSWGFSLGHAQLIGVAVVVFAILVFSQTNIHVKALFTKADDTKMLTYDEVRQQTLADSGSSDSSEYDQYTDNQFAMLNLKDEQGKVLGEEVGLNDIPEGSQVFTPEILSQIILKTTPNTDARTISTYVNQVSAVELNSDVIRLLADINSDDPQTVSTAKSQAIKIVQALGTVTVPEPFVEYHRYKMMYYTILTNIADVWLGKQPQTDLQSQTKAMMSVMNKLDQLKEDLNKKYSLDQ